mgnify:CR=1 FL=1
MRNFLKRFPKHYLEIQEGHQWLLQFGDQYRLSIINHKGSRGYPNLYEIGVFSDCDTMAALPGITEQDEIVRIIVFLHEQKAGHQLLTDPHSNLLPCFFYLWMIPSQLGSSLPCTGWGRCRRHGPR